MPGWLNFTRIPEEELSLSRDDMELIDRLAERLVSMGMAVPAIFFIEATKPLSYIGSQVMVFFGPFLELFFPGKTYYQFSEILEDRKNLDYLLALIEEKEDSKQRKPDCNQKTEVKKIRQRKKVR